MTEPILHLAVEDDWAAADDTYAPPAYADDGFVHCSAPHRIAHVAEARFPDRTDLLLLTIDPTRLTAPVVWEDTSGEGEDFPHVYGPIDVAAVTAVRPYHRGPDGRFPRPL